MIESAWVVLLLMVELDWLRVAIVAPVRVRMCGWLMR
jgi:hypothetical protein